MKGGLTLRQLHRWCGMLLGAFIVLAAATGAVLCFQSELDDWLNADVVRLGSVHAPLAPSQLMAAIEAHYPSARVARLPLDTAPGHAWRVVLAPRGDDELVMDEAWIDPASGRALGERLWGAPRLDRRHFIPFLHRLHYSLALGAPGILFMGVIGLAWLAMTCAGLRLAWPRAGQWRQLFCFRRDAQNGRLPFSLHRAAGLITAPVFLLIALTAVCFNLDFMFRPLIAALSAPAAAPATAALSTLYEGTSPEQAIELATAFFADARPARLDPDPAHRVYRIHLRRSRDAGIRPEAIVTVDMRAPRILKVAAPENRAVDAFNAWRFPLHTGQFLGWEGRILWSACGLLPLVLMATGLRLWLTRRTSRAAAMRRHPRREPA